MFTVDTMSRQPIYEQLVQQMENLVLSGLLKAGDHLPSVRSLSIELAVNPNTIQRAYSELETCGILCAVPGRGCFITADATQLLGQKARQRLEELDGLLRELALAGITEEEIQARVRAAYPKEGTVL
ncbi:MAG: GntR family transcriptional regulator [Clostridia bacterium]|nr:GntR family transcriptional regulator [Clostridia bacterium]